MDVSGQLHASGRFTPESKRFRYSQNMILGGPREVSFVTEENRNDSEMFKPVAQSNNLRYPGFEDTEEVRAYPL